MTKLDGKTPDLAVENIEQLRQIFPDVFEEGKIDFDKFKQVLGEYVDDEKERYNFTWNGKGKALRLAQTPTTGTLRPCPEEGESKNWDDTQNLYIEGDNLEVLKLLQKSYHGKIKMIYIDPPYNTGGDFVYPDDFSNSIENYKRITGQVDDEGKQLGTNSEFNGRYHTDWLNMMYPRLRTARNILANDGVIFVSADDHEIDSLKKICGEIFGENNFVGSIAWESKTKSQNTIDAFNKLQPKVEYILLYTKRDKRRFYLSVIGEKDYPEADDRGTYRWHKLEPMNASGVRGRETMIYAIQGVFPPEGKQWQVGELFVRSLERKGDVTIKDGTPYVKMRPDMERSEITEPFWGFYSKEVGTAESAKKELKAILKEHGFETVKPVNLIKSLIFHSTDATDTILDFFSGSATTAHAVMQLNAEDSGNRKFIMVQLPEPCAEGTEAAKAKFKNICEIGKERIRRAGEKIKTEIEEQNAQLRIGEEPRKVPDIGFKVFKLDSSNLKQWQPDYDDLETTLFDSISNYVEGRSELDVVYEIMLKMGMELTWPLETHTIGGKNVYEIGMGALMICLDDHITTEVAEGMVALYKDLAPETWRVVFKDNGFADDSAKVNIKEILKTAGLEEDAFTTV